MIWNPNSPLWYVVLYFYHFLIFLKNSIIIDKARSLLKLKTPEM